MSLVHIGPNGPGKCVAKEAGTCPYFPPEDHFNSMEDAEREYEARGERFAKTLKGLSSKRSLTRREKEVISQLKGLLDNREKQRQERNKDLVAVVHGAKMTPERARERLDYARKFAENTHNEHMGESLKHAKVLSTGSFKGTGKDKSRVSAGDVVKHRLELKKVDEKKDALKAAAVSFLRENQDKITWSDNDKENSIILSAKDHPELFGDGGKGTGDPDISSISVSLKRGGNRESEWNMEEFNKLKTKTRNGLMKKEERLDIEEVKKYLSPKQLESASSKVVSSFTIYGDNSKERANSFGPTSENVSTFKSSLGKNESLSAHDVSENLAKSLASVYAEHKVETGMTVSESKQKLSYKEERLKSVASKHGDAVLMPGRNVDEGLLFRSSTRYNQKALREMLTPEQIKASTITVDTIDKEKAKLALDKETYSKIFEAPVVSIRVNQKRK